MHIKQPRCFTINIWGKVIPNIFFFLSDDFLLSVKAVTAEPHSAAVFGNGNATEKLTELFILGQQTSCHMHLDWSKTSIIMTL